MTDEATLSIDITTTQAQHALELIRWKITSLTEDIDADFGYEEEEREWRTRRAALRGMEEALTRVLDEEGE